MARPGLTSEDDTLSVRVRPSSLKRDCDRRTTGALAGPNPSNSETRPGPTVNSAAAPGRPHGPHH
jgi:hypothetical protein